MNIFTKNRLLVGAVILLAALNLATLSTLGFLRVKPKLNPESSDTRPRFNHGKMIASELNLSPEQEAKFETLRKDYAEQTRTNRMSLQENYRIIMKELSTPSPNRQYLDSIAQEIGRLHVEQQESTIDHFLTLRQVCTPEQYEKLQQIFKRNMFRDSRQPDMVQRRMRMRMRMMDSTNRTSE